MAKAEAARADGIEAVADRHAEPPARAGGRGVPRRPASTSSATSRWRRPAKEARRLAGAGGEARARCSRSPTTTPAIRWCARRGRWCSEGRLGEIRVVQVEYAQDWLTESLEATGQKQADWRTDPARAGAGGCDRRHRHACVPARRLRRRAARSSELCAELSTFVAGRRLDDNVAGAAALRQRCARRALGEPGRAGQREQPAPARLRQPGGLEWRQEQPNQLALVAVRPADADDRARHRRGRRRGGAGHAHSGRPSRGLPRGLRHALRRDRPGDPRAAPGRRRRPTRRSSFPASTTASPGVEFIEAAVASSARGGRWVRLAR